MIEHLDTSSAFNLAGGLHIELYGRLVASEDTYPKVAGDHCKVVLPDNTDQNGTHKIKGLGTIEGYDGYQTLSHSEKTGNLYFTTTY